MDAQTNHSRHGETMRHATLLIIGSLLTASPAHTQASSQDWNNWVYRANSLVRAIGEGSKSSVDVMCRDIYREMAVKGLPAWARELTGVCDALKEGLTNGSRGDFCGKARRSAAILSTASHVADEPRAAPLAHELSQAMTGLHQGLCQ